MLILLDPSRTFAARQALGLTTYELAEKAGVSRVTLYKVENGLLKLGCQQGVARAIADALEVEMEEIAAGPPVRATRPDLRKS